jgi:transcription-repair coupling factor (superfamily II helicase)
LSSSGHTRVNFVEDRMQFAVIGDLINIRSVVNPISVRIFFEYDVVCAIRTFDPLS